ncbi:hypothetical protein MRX96_007504 [Rhipicephalus microplus]
MKKNKVALVTKIKESRSHKEAEKRCKRQIVKMLKEESRQQENRISRNLEAQNSTKKTALKRRPKEMAALRTQARLMS